MITAEARQLFKRSGLTYGDVLMKEKLQRLRNMINIEMVKSGVMSGTLRCKQRPRFGGSKERPWADIRCKAFYFDDREVVSFNPDGFIGFAGWAASGNVQPILEGFQGWVGEMAEMKRWGKSEIK